MPHIAFTNACVTLSNRVNSVKNCEMNQHYWMVEYLEYNFSDLEPTLYIQKLHSYIIQQVYYGNFPVMETKSITCCGHVMF